MKFLKGKLIFNRKLLTPIILTLFSILLSVFNTSGQEDKALKVGEEIDKFYESPHPYPGSNRINTGIVWRQEISYEGASYIAVHFKKVQLTKGDVLVVKSPTGDRSWSYSNLNVKSESQGFWSIHIYGETAVIEIHSQNKNGDYGYIIDKVAKGYSNNRVRYHNTEAICGEDDMREAKCYQTSEPQVYDKSRAVARLLINGTRACTGWLIGSDGHLITNNHCITNANDAKNVTIEFMAEGADCNTNCNTQFGCKGKIEATSTTLVQTNAALDYSLLELSNNVSDTYGFLQLRETGPVINERIYIPQHSRAWGKRIALLSDIGNSGFPVITSLSKPRCTGNGNGDIGYFADTNGGSSGSPVISYNDNLVVALHHCANCANRGINVNEIINDLGTNLPNDAVMIDDQPELACLTFDGIDDYIKISSAPSKAIATNDFTFEAWIEGNEDEQTQHPIIFSNRKASNAGGFKFFFHGLWGGSKYKMLSVQLDWKNYLIVNNGSYNGSLLDGNCHHVAVTLKNNILSFYADGELFGTRTVAGNPSLSSNVPLWIGSEQYTSNRFKGTISQVRMWKAARSATQIKNSMNQSLSGNAVDLVSYWEVNENSGQTIIDKTGLANGVVGQNVGINSTDPQWLGNGSCCFNQVEPPLDGCLTFDGVDDYIEISDKPSKAVATSDFTFETWIEGNEDEQTQHPIIFSNRKTTSTGGFKFFFHGLWGGSKYKMLCVQLNEKNYLIVNNGTYNGSLLDGNCHHVAITLNGNTLSFYADGELFGTRTVAGDPNISSDIPLWIGSEQRTSNRFKGNISQIRIWKTARSSTQIKDDMHNSLNGNTENLVGYWEVNEGSGQTIKDKTGLADGMLGSTANDDNNDPVWLSNGSCCFNQYEPPLEGCLIFDGQDDYIEISDKPSKSVATSDFTFEAWIEGNEEEQTYHPIIFSNRKTYSTGGFKFFFHALWGGSKHKMLCLQLNEKNYLIVNNGTYNGSLLDGNCHHVAVTLNGNTLSFYADGELFGTRTVTGDPDISSDIPLWIGSEQRTSNRFKGNISQIRIWKTARSSTQIKDDMHNSLNGNTENLVGYWEVNEGSGQTIKDKTGLADGMLGSTANDDNNDPVWLSNGSCCFNEVEPKLVDFTMDNFKNSIIILEQNTPNPAKGFTTISYKLINEKATAASLKIYSITGTLIKQFDLDESKANSIIVPLKDMQPGLYLYTITTNNGISATKKMMVKH